MERKKLINICKSSNSCRAIFFDHYGHQMALLAGFKNSRDIIITIDGDLSDPPEIIEDLLNINSQGYDVVNTVRIKEKMSFGGYIYKTFVAL